MRCACRPKLGQTEALARLCCTPDIAVIGSGEVPMSSKLTGQITFAAAFLWATVASAAPINPGEVCVIDGDTIRVFHSEPNVRLVGFNAPETRRARNAILQSW
jgi:endonuclease YncB( thermonuclease family)